MTLRARLRKPLLALHISVSVGWLGAVAAFIVLDVATVASADPSSLRAAYIAMDLLARWAILPLAAAALASGVGIALATKWGLFRHWWVVMTLLLTLIATLVLLLQLPLIGHRAQIAADPAAGAAELRGLGNMLLHSVGGLAVLLGITVLNVYKPAGLTRYGWRKQQQRPREPLGPAP